MTTGIAYTGLVVALLATFSSAGPTRHAAPTQAEEVSATEYAVYRTLLDQHYKTKADAPFQVIATTTAGGSSVYETRNRERLLRESDSTTFFEYERRRGSPGRITGALGVAGAIVLTDSTLAAIAAQGGPAYWERLRAQHPSVDDKFTFSRVGFNANGTRALAYAFRRCGMLCGEGGLFYLEKRDTGWAILRRLYVSAS